MSLYDKNWHKINIDISGALHNAFNVDNFLIGAEYVKKNHCGVWGYNSDSLTQMFTEEWLSYMQSLNLEVVSVLIFYRDAYFVFPEAHIDYLFGEDYPYVAINWVLGNDSSEIVWYNTPADIDQKPRRITQSNQGHEYVSWALNEVTEIDRHCIGNTPTIVRVDIPHNIIVNKNPRWSISVRCRIQGLEKSDKPQWASIVDNMKEYINDNNI
jgi:hypothetical protein